MAAYFMSAHQIEMTRFSLPLTNTSDLPDFIVKSTLGVALVSILLVTPFSVNNFIQGRYLLGLLTLVVVVLCTINAWFCYRGRYHEGINLFGIAPAITIAIAFTTHELGVVASYWAYLGVLALYFILPEKRAWIANIIFITIVFPVAWSVLEQPVAIRFSIVLLGTSFFALLSMGEITKQHYMLKKKAVTDNLTGLYNRSLLQSSLENAIHQSDRTSTAMTLIMLDLDHFKIINDELGHDVGDSVLKSMGEFLKKHFRASDMVFRIGGEEFLILIYNTDEPSSLYVAEKLRGEIERLPLIPDRTVTVSIGVSSLQSGISWEEWMKHCDENLYRAKSSGRNQVVV